MVTILRRGTTSYRRKKAKTRVRMPDGTILDGKAGQKALDERRRRQEEGEKYRVKGS